MPEYLVESHNKSTYLESGSVVYGECLYRGRFIAHLRSLSGRPCYQGDNDPMKERLIEKLYWKYPMEAFELELDGCSLHNGWEWVDARSDVESGKLHAVAEIVNEAARVRALIHTRLDGTSFIERWIEIRNEGASPMNLSRISPMSGLLWHMQGVKPSAAGPRFKVGVMPDAPWMYEGAYEERDIFPGTTGFESSNGRSGWGLPWFCVRNCASGESFIGHLEWSGNWRMEFRMVEEHGTDEAGLYFSIGPKARAPMRVIAPGESVSSPVMHLGHLRGDCCDWVQETHAHIRSLMPASGCRNSTIGAGRMVDGELEWLETEVKLASDMGMEYFMIDAGWFVGSTPTWFSRTGDWDMVRFGGSFEKAREMIHSRGMKFGIWIEPEAIGMNSRVYSENPGWAISHDGISAAREGREVCDLSKPEVARYVKDSIIKLIETHKADIIKIDYNTVSIGEHGENSSSGQRENCSYKYVQALYAMLDEIRCQYPDVAIENCAGGGGRNDLGMFRRCDVSCPSDHSMFPRSIKSFNNITMALPPERLRVYYRINPGYHMYGSLETQLRLLMFCTPIFVGFGRDENWSGADVKAVVLRYVNLYKGFMAEILPNCSLYHHTPGLGLKNEDPWCVMECAGGTKGFAAVFRLVDDSGAYVFYPKGMKRGSVYDVTLMNSGQRFSVDGHLLSNDGLRIALSGALSSEMLLYEEHR